jgi:hypothetical protein
VEGRTVRAKRSRARHGEGQAGRGGRTRAAFRLAALILILAFIVSVASQAASPLDRLGRRAGFQPLVPAELPSGMRLAEAALLPGTVAAARGVWLWFRRPGADLVLVESTLPLSGTGEVPPGPGRVRLEEVDGNGRNYQEGLLDRFGVYVTVTGAGLDRQTFARVVASIRPLEEEPWSGVLAVFGQR